MKIEMLVMARIESEMNRREHWSKRKRRFDTQKLLVALTWGQRKAPKPPVVVTLTRIGPRKLDDDNLAGGFKAVRDQVAKHIGLDDGDERVTWRYRQEKGKPKEYACRIEIEAA